MKSVSNYMDTIKRVLNGDYQDATAEEKNEAVREVIEICSAAAAAVAFQPIPFVDTVLISPIQIAQVQAIGRIHGNHLDKKSVLEILSTFGASILAQNVIMAAAKFVPFLGWLVTISMAYALTYAVGEVSDYYFKNGRGVASSELKEMFTRIYREKKEEKQQSHRANATLKEKLQQLQEAYNAGLIDEEQFAHKKEELLKNF